jgi:hypothetical protein
MLINMDSLQVSSQFDAQLVALGNWPLDKRRTLNRWLEQVPTDQKARIAAQTIASFALDLMKDDVSIEGRVRIKRLQSAASLLERLVFTTRELEKKFYRDHTNHMLKVALLARAIAVRKPFRLGGSKLETLTLASIFHDIAYPMSECGRIFSETLKTLKDCYSTAELFRSSVFRETRLDIESLAATIGENVGTVRTMLRQMNHGLLGAIEFQSFLSETRVSSYSEAIKAIALHDPEFKTKVDPLNDPVIGLLIIADELQDWGRPTDQEVAIIPRIEDFEIGNGRIKGRFAAKDYSNFSVLKQICSKMKNLQRIRLDPSQLEFSLVYDIDGFERIDHRVYESILQTLFRVVGSDLMDPSRNIDLADVPLFEKAFYGMEIGLPAKRALYDHLRSGESRRSTQLKGVNILLNQNINEMILSKRMLRPIRAIELSNEGHANISARVVAQDQTVKGTFYSDADNETLKYARFLAAEVRFINYMIHEIGGSKLERVKGFPKLEGFAEPLVIKKAAERLGEGAFLGNYDKLRLEPVVSCLRNKSCFLFA